MVETEKNSVDKTFCVKIWRRPLDSIERNATGSAPILTDSTDLAAET